MKNPVLTLLPLLTACAAAPLQPLQPQLDPGPGQREMAQLSARGVQIYECRAASAAGAAAWTLLAPEAQLFDDQGRPAGHHGAGPSWMAPDGSSVSGTVHARADAPVAGAIPWLLLDAHGNGQAGAFERVTRIQRINTRGGVAPVDGCSSTTVGARIRVPYQADYRLFVPA
jgi:hypothetical protein